VGAGGLGRPGNGKRRGVHEPAFDIFESIGESDGSSPRQTLAIGLYFLYILCSNILLLNLLIAIIRCCPRRAISHDENAHAAPRRRQAHGQHVNYL